MIETLFLDWLFCLGVGGLFAFAARRGEEPRDGTRHPGDRRAAEAGALRLGLAYLAAGVLPLAVAYYLWRPDWMWMYWVDASQIPVAVVVEGFALYPVCFIAGFAIGRSLPPRAETPLLAAGIALGVGAVVAARTRLLQFGSLEAFRSGGARDGLTPELSILLVAGLASLAALVLLLRRAGWRGILRPDR